MGLRRGANLIEIVDLTRLSETGPSPTKSRDIPYKERGWDVRCTKAIHVERGVPRRSVNTVVQSELNKDQKVGPLSGLCIAQGTDDILYHAYDTLTLTISLWMVCRRHRQLGAKHLKEALPKLSGKSWITIANNTLGQPVITENVGKKQLSCTASVDRRFTRCQMHHLAEWVDKDHNTGITVKIRWIAKGEIHSH